MIGPGGETDSIGVMTASREKRRERRVFMHKRLRAGVFAALLLAAVTMLAVAAAQSATSIS